jgi:hypothetical protein
MPLIKSKSDKAFKSNIKAEMHAGKPQKQALAIAYATKRAAKKAMGGRMSTNPMDYDSDIDYKEALQKNRYPKYDSNFTREDAQAVRDVKAKYDQKYAGMTMAQRRDALLAKDKARQVKLGLPKKSGGGKVKSCW